MALWGCSVFNNSTCSRSTSFYLRNSRSICAWSVFHLPYSSNLKQSQGQALTNMMIKYVGHRAALLFTKPSLSQSPYSFFGQLYHQHHRSFQSIISDQYMITILFINILSSIFACKKINALVNWQLLYLLRGNSRVSWWWNTATLRGSVVQDSGTRGQAARVPLQVHSFIFLFKDLREQATLPMSHW